jgi:CubicO group peptidase (beta-lactamase class C family)
LENPTITGTLDFGREIDPVNVDMLPHAVGRLVKVFEDQVTKHHLHPAAQLVVLRHGRVVLDRVLGVGRNGKPVTTATPFLTFSVTKAFTGICIHRLIEQGKVELDAPVAEYWPEFGCRGKESTTIQHVFLHQAGIPTAGMYRLSPLWPFWGVVVNRVGRLKAQTKPGSHCAYHQMNYGFILGEVVRRVTGQMVDEYLREEFLAPLGLERTWMRIPRGELTESPQIYSGTKGANNAAFGFDLPFVRQALLPAASLHSTARDLAVFYQMLINQGQYNGKRLLKSETIHEATHVGYEGWDDTSSMNVRWAYGFHLGSGDCVGKDWGGTMGKGSTLSTFGHFGMATSMAWADADAKLVLAFTCNRMLNTAGYSARWQDLSDALWNALSDNPNTGHSKL